MENAIASQSDEKMEKNKKISSYLSDNTKVIDVYGKIWEKAALEFVSRTFPPDDLGIPIPHAHTDKYGKAVFPVDFPVPRTPLLITSPERENWPRWSFIPYYGVLDLCHISGQLNKFSCLWRTFSPTRTKHGSKIHEST